MPITAPQMVTFKRVSYRFIDHEGKKRTVSLRIALETPFEIIYAHAQALGEASNLNLYEIAVEEVFAAPESASIALQDTDMAIQDHLYISMSSPGNPSERVYVPAPKDDVFVNQHRRNGIDASSTLLHSIIETAENLLKGYKTSGVTSVRQARKGKSIHG